jgi:hypothetical protein
MRTISGVAVALAAMLNAACNTSPHANDPTAALTEPEPEPGTGTTNRTSGTNGTSGTSGTSEGVRVREVTIPAGTVLSVRLNTAVASDTSRIAQRVDGRLTRAVRVGGVDVLNSGAMLRGTVTNARRSGKVKGRASVAFRFDQLSANGSVYRVSTRTVSHEAPGTKKKDAAAIGVPAAGGANRSSEFGVRSSEFGVPRSAFRVLIE